ncbi:MAG: hypothetical protein U0Z26_09495 [Anaerolineales bacterium]
MAEDYILAAKAVRGCLRFTFKDHALKNSMLPLVTIIAINLGLTAGKHMFKSKPYSSWPGLRGTSRWKKDYPLLQEHFYCLQFV